ncbi:hypothetical protein HBI98_23175, partial [Aeromonas veronii]|nr:hypothetical protein [Aeromonas veronii]
GPHCVTFIKQKAEIMMNLGGISYTACLNRVDDKLFEELSEATEGAITREDYDRANVLNAFRGENIFVDPARIRSKLQQRMQGSFKLPVNLSSDKIADIKEEMKEVKEDFVECMQKALGDLQRTLKATEEQLQIVCAGKQG